MVNFERIFRKMQTAIKNNRFFTRILRLDYGFTREIEEKLEKNRIQTSFDLRNMTDDNLIKMYAFTKEEIDQIKEKFYECNSEIITKNFFDLSNEEEFITSGNKKFDEILGGKGIRTGKITQISGTAGAGKTQFCLKICLTVQLDRTQGGLKGEALYLETEDCFRPTRAIEMAKEMSFSNSEDVLKHIHCFNRFDNKLGSKVVGVDHLVDILYGKDLENFFNTRPAVRLFIIDSISYLFRYDYNGTEQCRLNHQMSIIKKLKYLACKYHLAIVLTNQVKLSQELPSMGELWNSIPSTSILLRRTDLNDGSFEREARLLKSLSSVHNSNFKYTITKAGIEEIV